MAVLLSAAQVRAATPELQVVLPRGVQRGSEVDLDLRGSRLTDAQDLLFFGPGLTITSFKVVNAGQAIAHVKVAADAPIGEVPVRLRSATGISELRTLWVIPFKVVPEKPGNTDFDHPQPVELNTTVTGVIQNEQAQYFQVELKKGDPLTVEAHGMRLGDNFDPYVAIMDEKKFEVAVSDDTALAMQDPIASMIAPRDGKYTIQLRDSSYAGGGQAHYLLHVGNFPRPRAVYPLGGQAGQDLKLKFIGDINGAFEQTLKLPSEPSSIFHYTVERNGLTAPSANPMRVSPFRNVLESEPNDDPSHATVAAGDLPVALNGIIEKPGDVDFFRFTAKRGQPIDIRVYARALRSPLDAVLVLYNEKGNYITANDDSGGPDSYVRFDPPADGQYLLSIFDQLRQGGPDYTYRIELTPVLPRVVLSIPQFNINSQERWTIPIPRGGRYATLMRATRSDFGGDVAIACPDLPPGVTMVAPDVSPMTDLTPVLFEAKADAPIGGKTCNLTVKATDPKVKLEGEYTQNIDLVIGPNNQPLYTTHVHEVPVAVTKEAPYTLHLEQPKVPLVRDGIINLKVTVQRRPDYKKAISLRMVFSPPGTGAAGGVDIPAGKDEVLYPMNANGSAPLRKWKICVAGVTDEGGELWTASDFVELDVADAYLSGKIQMAAAEQGKPAQVFCKLDQKIKFDGKAKVQLIGLPAGVSAVEQEITAKDQQVILPIKVDAKSPVGNHGSLFCRVTVMKDGQEIVHNIAYGGVLRIDPPPAPPKGAVAQAPKVQPKATANAKPLSRLEKLRQEQGANE
jgi:hypothetical protein